MRRLRLAITVIIYAESITCMSRIAEILLAGHIVSMAGILIMDAVGMQYKMEMKFSGIIHVTEAVILEGTGRTKEKRQDAFASCHPIVSFIYFVFVIGCAMFMMHPVFLIISCLGGWGYYFYLKGRKAVVTSLWLMFPVFFLSAVLNPLLNHQGVTILFYMWTGNPFTLESVIYGLASGVMLVSVLNWFSCYQSVMTSDKFIYLFGKIIPAISLILSMVLRFVPKYKHQIQKVSQAQQCIGRDVSDGSLLARAKHGMKILSIMTTWALENSVETADSMRSRGYGLRGRTNYTIYRFDTRDRGMLAGIVLCGSVVIAAVLLREIEVLYFPVFQLSSGTGKSMAAYLGYGILCFLPLAVNLAEDVKWRYLRSTI